MKSIPTALTIAGSDTCGGAGIQADLKTFAALRVYGMSVVTAITAQNTRGVDRVFDVPSSMLTAQMHAALSDIPPDAVKIGMLSNAENVTAVAATLTGYACQHVVLDPVMAASAGTPLLDPDGRRALCRELLPIASLVTPNLAEAEVLTERPVGTVPEMEVAARAIHDLGVGHVLVTGGHLPEGLAIDVFFDGETVEFISGERIETSGAYGTGCVLSSAAAAFLARGMTFHEAVTAAKSFTAGAIRKRLHLGQGSDVCDPLNLSDGEKDTGI